MKINGKIENLLMFDGIDLGASAWNAEQPVEKDAEGVPVAWRLLKTGVNELTKDGQRFDLELSADDVRQIEGYFKEKGVKIPVDSRHFHTGQSRLDAGFQNSGKLYGVTQKLIEAYSANG